MVGHDLAVLALPVSLPLEAVPVADSSPVYVERRAVRAPLPEASLSFGVGGHSATYAGLCVCVLLNTMLALPVTVCADGAREVTGPVRSETLLVARL